jgi:alkylated DNA nucleotide flippase Atl1
MREEFVEAVLAVVELVPAGAVVAYGDISELLGAGGPRHVGSVMSQYGGEVPWWRVLKASGAPPEAHEASALRHYLAEGTPLRGDPARGPWRVDIGLARWAPTDEELEEVEAIAGLLDRRLHRPADRLRELSDPDGGMDP